MLIKKDPAFIQSYLEDSSNLRGGYAEEVAIPRNIDETASLLKKANSEKTPVTVSGAGTGQSGARIPFGGLVLSTEKLNRIKEIKKETRGGTALVGPGVSIKDLKEAGEKKGLFYAYDPTEQTAFAGGTIATNASGARSFKYGPTRKHVKGLTVLLADGSVFSFKRGEVMARGGVLEFEAGSKRYRINMPSYRMPRTRKNSAGYYTENNMDLIDLFVGQEGTLAFIAEAELQLLAKPEGFFSCFAFFMQNSDAWNFSTEAMKNNPVSIEYFDSNSLDLLREKYGNVPEGATAAVFFEDEIEENEDAVLKKWEKLLAVCKVSLDDTWVAMNEKMHREFLDKRHFIPERMNEMAKRSGFPKVSTDLAVPVEKLKDMFAFYEKSLQRSGLKHFIFGHIGDAHLHVNMLPSGEKSYESAKKKQLEFVKKAISLGGTISAEHGIGKTKKEFLKLLYDKKELTEMFGVKKALDPNLILGRGNIFDFF